ncbi:cytidyltransferase [Clostridium faecium]|uniref:nicotinate-nucleotide adenylyltransferase n=1 Tax=Clostridium faecium TaxID=2762223 RepID=A0ABR8YSH5_9CLOT|nr:cytidyltransferase [Clostridium faecium]MBD8047205.1 cytidyltransferase [Clostridium faecium]
MEVNFQSVYDAIQRKILAVKWINKEKLDRNIINHHVKSEYFIETLKKIIVKKDYTAKSALILLKPLILELSRKDILENSDNGFLLYLYEYSLSKVFPEAVSIELNHKLDSICNLYFRVFRIISFCEKHCNGENFISKYPMEFLRDEELKTLECSDEYLKFVKAFNDSYIYEMMKINGEITGFNTLEHISGVHYLAMYIARQIKNQGIKVDLGRVSGSAAGHDIGKYGCKKNEMKRVPYLHYYYSDIWFKRHGINYIRNIAINHSTWDLEFENLSIESLILIYSDFRVKNKEINNKNQMCIFSLKESFDVILSKLDNVDEMKERRYRRVYSKLRDFENFLKSINVETEIKTIDLKNRKKIKKPLYSLTKGEEIVDNLKYMAINHNINLMYILRDEQSLNTVIEEARSEKNWRNLREYIRIFEEYSTYLTQSQKIQTINFLYENLAHPEDDIRRHSAEIIGKLIAVLDEEYRKELPDGVADDFFNINSKDILKRYIDKILFPSHKIISIHRYWIGYSLSTLIKSLFENCGENKKEEYKEVIINYYDVLHYKNLDNLLFLIESANYIPLDKEDKFLDKLYVFVFTVIKKRNIELRLSALNLCINLMEKLKGESVFFTHLKDYLNSVNNKAYCGAEVLLRYRISQRLDIEDLSYSLRENLQHQKKNIQEIYLSNLKSATEWTLKKYQIELILDFVKKYKEINALQAAIHFCNLLKVSAVEEVRVTAGCAIVQMMNFLSFSERNEVAIELLRSLEIEGHKITEYIPRYLGQVLLYIPPKELDEVIDDLAFKVKVARPSVKTLMLKTIGVILEYYKSYGRRFNEDDWVLEKRKSRLLSIILNGFGDYVNEVKRSAFTIIGKVIFGSKILSLEEKKNYFDILAKKILTLIINDEKEELFFLSNAAGLAHIYRFIADYNFFIGDFNMEIPKKIAFFPGTFDPFSLSHKEIAKTIRNLGYEVYLSVDEFSWSKKTLPHLLRRNILNMSIASEFGIFIYPESEPVNLSNRKDIQSLKNNFKGQEVFIVAGEDVITNASSYKLPYIEGSIQDFSHIIIERNKNNGLLEHLKKIRGTVHIIKLPNKYADISSTQIRNYIDSNKDISSIIDPLAEQYIYENGFYQREPMDKTTLDSLSLEIKIIEKQDEEIINSLCSIANNGLRKKIEKLFLKPSGRIVVLKNCGNDEIQGFALIHWARSSMLYGDIKDMEIAQYMREKSQGRIILLDGFYIKNHEKNKKLLSILITETLAFACSRDYEYALYREGEKDGLSSMIKATLALYGFQEIFNSVHLVNMSSPCILNFDIENLIKEPFRSNSKIKAVINDSRIKLQQAICRLFPGNLVLPFDSNMTYQGLIRKICRENKVPEYIANPRILGEAMCVPYGDILDRYIIPNTVTKSLHTEKYFNPNMKSFKIGEFPHYLNLENQIKMLKSFNRPVILVDNLLHKGYRMKAIRPIFKKEKINIQKIIVAILSGRGKDFLDYQGGEVDCLYFIPRLRIWFNESALYPFIGGDAVWRGEFQDRNLLPSINLIMPYTSPKFIRGAKNEDCYNLSKVCIENSMNILTLLEDEYHNINERNLTLLSLGQVFTIPRTVDRGLGINYDLNQKPSHYLKNDLEKLERFEDMYMGR